MKSQQGRLLLMAAAIVALCTKAFAAPLTITVEGPGYLRLIDSGRVVYAKTATLAVKDGKLADKNGATFLPSVTAINTDNLSIDSDGFVKKDGANLGRLVLAAFDANAPLTQTRSYLSSEERPKLVMPGGEFGMIQLASSPVKTSIASTKTPNPSPVPTHGGPVNEVSKGSNLSLSKITATIEITEKSEISGDQIRLGDIAKIVADETTQKKLAAITLGDAPMIRVPRAINEFLVNAKLRAAGFDPNKITVIVPQKASVTRKSNTISHQTFVDLAIKTAAAQLGISPNLKASRTQPDFDIAEGDVQLEVENCLKSGSSISVMIAIKLNGKRVNSRTIQLTADGDMVSIKTGEAVKIVMRSAGVNLEVLGKARTAGWLGQAITVVSDTGSVHTGVVVAPGKVEVKL